MDRKNQDPEGSGPTCDCCEDPTVQNPDCPPVDCKKRYKALVLACIDPRMQKPVYKYLQDRDLTGKYSQVTIAGAAIGVVAPEFEDWSQTFWDNLSISLELHSIRKVIVINHRGCGAASAAYGYFKEGSKGETRLHCVVLAEFRRQLTERHPQLAVETLLMDLDGTIERLP